MTRAETTRCCSAVASIVAASLAIAAQTTPTSSSTPLSLFPVQTLWTLPLNNQLTAAPAYDERHGYFAIEGNRIVAYDLSRGAQIWIAAAQPLTDLVTGEDLLFVAEPGALVARRVSDGQPEWQLPFGDTLAVPPVWDNGWLVVATIDGGVLAFRARDGHLVWRRDIGTRAEARPALAADRIYVPLADGRVAALRVDSGMPVWERRLGGPATDMLALDERVYSGSKDNFLYCLDATDGHVEWRWRTGGDLVGVPVVDEHNVYFVSLDNVLRALSRKSGVQRWMRGLPLRPTHGPLQAGAMLLVTGLEPILRTYNVKDGTPAGDLDTGGELAAPPHRVSTRSSAVPEIVVVTRNIAKGATVTLLGRRIEPLVEPVAPLPNPLLPMSPMSPSVGR